MRRPILLIHTDKHAVSPVTVRFHPLPSAPILKSRVFKISASQKFETVVKFLRKKLNCKDTDSVFCYVNSVFAPSLDEGVGGLWRVGLLLYISMFACVPANTVRVVVLQVG